MKTAIKIILLFALLWVVLAGLTRMLVGGAAAGFNQTLLPIVALGLSIGVVVLIDRRRP